MDLKKKENNQEKGFTVSEIRDKLAKYCAYQDRCHWEVEQKLNEFNLIPEGRDEIIIYLIQNNFLNEERFAKSFVRGKFNQKHWGRIKIKSELKKKRIPTNLIQIALKEIDEDQYQSTLTELFEKKKNSLKSERDGLKKKFKIQNFLLQKGFERENIQSLF